MSITLTYSTTQTYASKMRLCNMGEVLRKSYREEEEDTHIVLFLYRLTHTKKTSGRKIRLLSYRGSDHFDMLIYSFQTAGTCTNSDIYLCTNTWKWRPIKRASPVTCLYSTTSYTFLKKLNRHSRISRLCGWTGCHFVMYGRGDEATPCSKHLVYSFVFFPLKDLVSEEVVQPWIVVWDHLNPHLIKKKPTHATSYSCCISHLYEATKMDVLRDQTRHIHAP